MNTLILKFGGTSVSTPKSVQAIFDIVKREKTKNPVIIVSALSKVTDLLLSLTDKKVKKEHVIESIRQIHKSLIQALFKEKTECEKVLKYVDDQLLKVKKIIVSKHFDKALIDRLISYGEILSSQIIAQFLDGKGLSAKQVLASNIILTDDVHGEAEFMVIPTTRRIKRLLVPVIKKNIVPVITGFIGSTRKGHVTTLGRGGSDYTAAIVGFCLNSSEIQIWTDVDGVFTADPRIVKSAKLLKEISYREASEMAFFGAKILHPRTIRPAVSAKIPIRVLNTFNPKNEGTRIVDIPLSKNLITAISFKHKATLVNIYSTDMLFSKGFLVSLFTIFSKHNISVDLVSVSEVSVSVTLDNDENLDNAIKELKKFTNVTFTKNLSIVSLIGDGIVNSSTTIQNIFTLLAKRNILVKMISLGATNINVSIVIDSEKLDDAVTILHNRLLLKKLVK